MDDARERAQQLMLRWDEELRRELPEGTRVFDVHVHLGHDIDGMVGRFEELEFVQSKYGIQRAFMFCLDEPDRHPGFRAGNDRTLEFARRSGDRLIPFVRLDLTQEPIAEATRCIDAGARGIKLHPRAQGFDCDDDRLAPVFELAAGRKVPILIHGGRGLPPIADGLHELVDRYGTQLIIAHAGIADMSNLAAHFSGHPKVFFDTSVWSPVDLLDAFRQLSPEQVLYASDYPYGQQPSSLLIALRTAARAGLTEAQIDGMLWDNAARLAAGEPQPELTTPQGSETFAQPMVMARVHQYLSMATPLLWTRQADTVGVLGLALNACEDRNGRAGELDQIRELLVAARDLWRTLPEVEDDSERVQTTRATFRLIHLADILAVTSRA